MTNISERAKTLLHERKLSIVVMNNGTAYTSEKHGISPILDLLDTDREYMKGAYIADKVIGKAAAMLIAANGAGTVYADVISRHAIDVLKKSGIDCDYEKCVPYIINRQGDGMCPMEETVLNIENMYEAEELLRKKLNDIKNRQTD